jgi:hypothetical protein
MNNLILIFAILASAAVFVARQHQSLAAIRRQNSQLAATRATVRETLSLFAKRRSELEDRLRAAEPAPSAQKPDSSAPRLPETVSAPDPDRQGGWPSGAPYFYFPKKRLNAVKFELFNSGQLADDAVTLFGMTPSEREACDQAYRQLVEQFRNLEIQHLEPVEQPGRFKSMVSSVSYRIPSLTGETAPLREAFQSSLAGALGASRAQYLTEPINGYLTDKLENLGAHARVITFGYSQQRDGSLSPGYSVLDETEGTGNARGFKELGLDWPITYYAQLFGLSIPIEARSGH